MKLYWKIYLVLAATTLGALILVVWLSFSLMPGIMERQRNRTLDRFEDLVATGQYSTREDLVALADSMGIFLRVVREDDSRDLPPGQPQPPAADPRHFRLIPIPGTPVSVLATAILPAPRFLYFVLMTVFLFISQAVALRFGLRSVFQRTLWLTRATGEFGKGKLNARYPELAGGDELDALGRSFNEMADRIISLLDSNNELLNSVAHELRTPLARLSFALELARSNPHSVAEKLGIMEKDLFELDRLVSELLEFNRIRNAEAEIEQVVLYDVCTEAADGERVHDPSIEILVSSAGSRLKVMGDHRLLLRAVSNLVRNAVRHASSRVDLRITRSPGHVSVVVEDDGPGFPAGFTEKATKPFVKGENSHGSGLGLSIVKRIAEKHDGQLILKNTPRGALAEIRLPE